MNTSSIRHTLSRLPLIGSWFATPEAAQGASLRGFIEFIARQPVDEPINHNMGWLHCAVGKYREAVGGDAVARYSNGARFETALLAEERALPGAHPSGEDPWEINWDIKETWTLMAMLNEAACLGAVDMSTYGKLMSEIKQLPHLRHLVP